MFLNVKDAVMNGYHMNIVWKIHLLRALNIKVHTEMLEDEKGY
jgi:hypothetical protein